MNLDHKLFNYLETIFGQAPELTPLKRARIRGLPHFLANAFQLFECDFFGRPLIFAKPINKPSIASPTELARQGARLQDHFAIPVALILPHVEAYQRNRLVQQGVPFIVPNRQLFLPQLMIDLSERFPRVTAKKAKHLSAPAQLVIIYHLLMENVGVFSLRELAKRTSYSAMTISKVQDELSGFGLCNTESIGRSKYLRFKFDRQELWHEALPFLRSPVRAMKAVRDAAPGLLTIRAGISALSTYTNISPDRVPTYAIKDSVFKKALMNGEVVVTPDQAEASAMAELWKYDPAFVNQPDVDVLSLFLTLKDNPDERVQRELERLMADQSW